MSFPKLPSRNPDNVWFFGVSKKKAYTDDVYALKDAFDDVTSSSLEKLNLAGVPVCRDHDRNDVIGEYVAHYDGRDTDKFVIGYIDDSSFTGRYVIEKELLKEDGLGDLSLGYDSTSIIRPDRREV